MSKTPATEVAINEAAIDLFEEMLEMDDILKAIVKETKLGPVILDLGVKTQGGFLAGEYVTQVCMGGLAEVSISLKSYSKEFALPTITVITDYPVVATMGSQFAGWSINKENYRAMASGPIRLFAKKPKDIYELLNIKEDFDETIIILETNHYPSDDILRYISEKSRISLKNIGVILTPTTSIAGATQIAGRSIETAIHKLLDLGMDISTIVSASGSCPIAPVAKKNSELMMGRTNDMLIYGSDVFLYVDYKDDSELLTYLQKAISSNSSSYGKLFYEIVKKVKGDFYKIDKGLFAPARLTVNNITSGKTHVVGAINVEMLQKSCH